MQFPETISQFVAQTTQLYKNTVGPLIDDGIKQVQPIITRCQVAYENQRIQLVEGAKNTFSPEIAGLVDKVSKVFPESLLATALFMGVLPILTVPLLALKAIQVISPFIKEQINPDSILANEFKIGKTAREEFQENMKQITPALATGTAITALIYATKGVLFFSPKDIALSTVFGLSSFALFRALMTEAKLEEQQNAEANGV